MNVNVRFDSTTPDFQALFEGAPSLYLVLTPDLRIVAVSDAYCRATMTTREGLLGRALFEAFPDNPADTSATGVSNLRASLERVLKFRRPDTMAVQKYDIPRPAAEGGGFEERYWSPLNAPVLDADGEVAWIIHRVEDVTEVARMQTESAASQQMLQQQLSTIEQLREANRALASRNEENVRLQRDVLARTAELQREIAEREKIAEDLKSAGTFFNLVVENVPAMLAVKDARDLRFVLFNRAGEELTGIPREEMLGRNDYDFFPRDQAEYFIARDREVLNSGRLQVIPEEQINTRHKGVRLLRTLKLPVPDEHGRPKYLLALCEDITERRQTEAALRESEARLRGVLAASPDAMIVVDPAGRVLFASDRVTALFGYPPDELVGQTIEVLLPQSIREILAGLPGESAVARLRTLGIGRELSARRRDGGEFPTEITLSPERADGLVVAAFRDVTDRRAVESQLRHAQKMEAIGNLTGGMAHDFNNLLGIIIGNLDILGEQQNVDPDTAALAREALDAALRGADLTQRLLAFARRQPLRPQRIDINDLVGRLGKILTRTLAENIEIGLDLDAATWPVVVDPAQLEASLLNIANNARDAMPRGGVLTITTSNRSLDEDYAALHPGLAAGNYAMIEISDSGTGIPPEVLGRIFEPFFTTKEQGKGTGLGLSMVFGFMKQSGGHINVYSEPNVGTTFRLYLPRAVAVEEADDAHAPIAIERGGHETILAVEDNGGLRRVVARQLKELGYRLIEAEDGPSAMKVLEAGKVDLLFTDIVMPGGMSGYDLARAAMMRWPAMKVVLTSGFPEVKLNGNGGAPAGMRLLIKPYRKADLARLLREVLDG